MPPIVERGAHSELFNLPNPTLNNHLGRVPGFDSCRSAYPQQVQENRQRTPPVPEAPTVPASAPFNKLFDFQTRHKQLKAQLFDISKADLFYTLTRSNDATQPKTAVLNISALQNLAVYQLQFEISCYVAYMYDKSRFCRELDGFTPLVDLMKKYSDAVRHLDYMRQCALRGYDEDPFLMKSSRALERSILETTQLIPHHVLPKGPLPLPTDHGNIKFRFIGRNKANRAALHQNQLSRFAMSALGGLLLLIPMLIMANVPGKTPSLITTCVALAGFSALVTLFTELGPHEILATTAAYAAVLVVFVGTSLANQSVATAAAPPS